MSVKIRTAMMPMGGGGTRCYPFGSSNAKAVAPVYLQDEAVPLIDFMLNDCQGAGIQHVIFVTTPEGARQIDASIGKLNSRTKQYLIALGRTTQLRREEGRRNRGMTYTYIVQSEGQYGTAVPLNLVQKHTNDECIVVMGGDDITYHPDGVSELGRMVRGYEASGADHAIMGTPVSPADAPKYGILEVSDDALLKSLIEKPSANQVPLKPFANISRYIFNLPRIRSSLEEEMTRVLGPYEEHPITNIISNAVLAGQTFYVHGSTGKYLDGGNPSSMYEAITYIRANPPQSRI